VSSQVSILTALNQLRQLLAAQSETAALDAQVLLAAILVKPRAWVIAHPEHLLSQIEIQSLDAASARLENREPLPYILGYQEFYGLRFTVSPAVLIPRPETEHLVEAALDWLKNTPGAHLAADVGTGSGCIAACLAAYRPSLHVIATDLSSAALQIAHENVHNLRLSELVWLVQCDLLDGIVGPLDLICANLPYIPTDTLDELRVSAWEPDLALWGGTDGLELIRRLLAGIGRKLSTPGLLLLEIEASQGPAAANLVRTALPKASVKIIPDLAGFNRLIAAYR
jgi:release factor glutamine methyltransferase